MHSEKKRSRATWERAQIESQRLWRHWECGNKQEGASCWILYYSPSFMQTQAVWVSSLLSNISSCLWLSSFRLNFHSHTIWIFSRVISNRLNMYSWNPFKGVFLTLVWSCVFQFFCWINKVLTQSKSSDCKKQLKAVAIILFLTSLFRSLGLPPSPSRTPCRVWKPPRDQLHRAAECAGSPPAQPHTTRSRTIRPRKPARAESWGTFTCVTAASKSFKWTDIHYITTHTHGCMHLHTTSSYMCSNVNLNLIKMQKTKDGCGCCVV